MFNVRNIFFHRSEGVLTPSGVRWYSTVRRMDPLIQLVEVETFDKLLYTIRLVLWDLDVLSSLSRDLGHNDWWNK